jgi:hypothetical protein
VGTEYARTVSTVVFCFACSLTMVRCAGCHHDFTVSGYSLHIHRTGSSACIAAYHGQINHMDSIDGVDDDMEVFSGDCFPNYQDDDFEWPENEQELEGL